MYIIIKTIFKKFEITTVDNKLAMMNNKQISTENDHFPVFPYI